jgi:hypothetical protein
MKFSLLSKFCSLAASQNVNKNAAANHFEICMKISKLYAVNASVLFVELQHLEKLSAQACSHKFAEHKNTRIITYVEALIPMACRGGNHKAKS